MLLARGRVPPIVQQLSASESGVLRVRYHVLPIVDDLLQLLLGHAEERPERIRVESSKPWVKNRDRQLDMPHSACARLPVEHGDSAVGADLAVVFLSLKLAAGAPEGVKGAEGALAGEPFGDGLARVFIEAGARLDLAPRPATDHVRRCETDPDFVHLVDVVGAVHVDRLAAGDVLRIESRTAEFSEQEIGQFRGAEGFLLATFDDGLVSALPADGVVRFDRQELPKIVRRTVRLQRPDLHLPQLLASVPFAAGDRLLRGGIVVPGGPRLERVVCHVDQLPVEDEAHR